MPDYWNDEDDANLRKALELYPDESTRAWKRIAMHVPGRTHIQCLQRWSKVLKPGLIKGSWSKEEDAILSRLVLSPCVLQTWGWGKIAQKIPGRTAKQCRERWRCNLDPTIDKSPWTPEEDAKILLLQGELGNRWATISTQLKGRTENAVKTRYRSLLRKKKKQWTPEEDSVLLRLKRYGSSWKEIAKALPSRTKNGVKVRYKHLVPECGRRGKGRPPRERNSPKSVDEAYSSSCSTSVATALMSLAEDALAPDSVLLNSLRIPLPLKKRKRMYSNEILEHPAPKLARTAISHIA
jgi:hypothetical protein